MRALIDKLVVLTGCFLLSIYLDSDMGMPQIFGVLTAVTFLCLCTCCNPDMVPLRTLKPPAFYVEIVLFAAFLLAGLMQPFLTPFLPLLFYELAQENGWQLLGAAFFSFLLFGSRNLTIFLLLLLLFVLAFWLKCKTMRLLLLEQNFRQFQDNSTEYHLLLQQKNQELIRQQDYEIHVATLKERNRIAREIHDSVGHMLSRSILQSGALIAMNRDDTLREPLELLKDTLSLAMDSIRESVHDLHDDSVDLKLSLQTMLRDFSGYEVHMEYDMGAVLPREIRYCFIAIAKEALSNISRHSNATRIRVTAREHPGFYQLIVEDNGTGISSSDHGIGLTNMRERVEQLQGRFLITTEQGFRIFVSVPK